MKVRAAFAAAVLGAVCIPGVARAVASSELYHSQAYRYGRFEARVRFAPSDGVISSFFLWKVGSDGAGTYWNELDFEKLGADCVLQTNPIYGNPEQGHEEIHSLTIDMCSAYHTYRFEWTPDYIAWSVDGEEIRRETGEVAEAFAQNASGGMRVHFNVWPGNEEFGGNFSEGSLPVHQYVSWAQYSSYDGAGFELQWREEFDGGLPNGWALGNWPSPFSRSTHNAANVSFVDGIAILSLTADNATGFQGVPPDDVDTSTSSGGGTTTGGSGTDDGSPVGTGGSGTGGSGADAATTLGDATSDVGVGGTSTLGTTGSDSANSTGSAGGPSAGATTVGVGGAVAGGSTMGVATHGGAGTGGSAATGLDDDSGCACALGPQRGPARGFGLVGVVALVLSRRRRSGGRTRSKPGRSSATRATSPQSTGGQPASPLISGAHAGRTLGGVTRAIDPAPKRTFEAPLTRTFSATPSSSNRWSSSPS